jgi:hypothetical protein
MVEIIFSIPRNCFYKNAGLTVKPEATQLSRCTLIPMEIVCHGGSFLFYNPRPPSLQDFH